MKKPTLAGFLSAIIWGSGQAYNGQWLKGIIFFIFQVALVGTELLTGNYFASSFTIRDNAGFFVKGLWGATTLGTQGMVLTENGLTPGDHSIMLLIQGIISTIVLIILLVIFVINIRDAYKSAKLINETGIVLSSKEWLIQTFEHAFEYIILIPSSLMLLMFSLMPIIFGFLVGFTNYNSNNLPPTKLVDWVGLNNFKFLFSLGESQSSSGNIWFYTFWNVFLWTIIFAVVATATPFFLGLFQAVILNNKRVFGKKIWRSILILPWAIPAMISQLNFQQLFNGQFGPINQYLMQWGIIDSPIYWLTDPNNPWIPRLTILAINLWLGFPYFMALMSGVMTSISKDIYEAAEIDGASERKQFWQITLPLVLAQTAPLLVMSFASNFNNFGLIYFLTAGGPVNPNYIYAGNTDILISWIYKLTVDFRMYNMASIMSIIIFLIIGTFSAWNFTRTAAFKED
ncbi:MAG TPA: sugar ABC transporter permease [Firmicutes bacterium]|nr:sugar ABC transporter permease [Bacillota bacterium]